MVFSLSCFLGIDGKLYSIIHLADNLASSLKNGIVHYENIFHVSNIRTQIEATQISPEDGFKCSLESYDVCLARERQLLNTNCALPFEDIISSNNVTCSSFEQGVDTVNKILDIQENCEQMCLKVNIRYSQEPEHYLLALTRQQVLNGISNQDFGYHYKIPKDVRLLTTEHDYTAPVALGFFGSIVGIFTGISILSFLILVTDRTYINSSIRKGFLLILEGGLYMYLAGVFLLLFYKFLQYPTTESVNFIQTKTDFSISVCSKHYTYKIQSFFDGIQTVDRLNNITFWQNWRNMSKMIDSIAISNGSHEVYWNGDDDVIDIQFFIVPTDVNSIAFCNVIDLTPYGMVEILDLAYTTEIEISMHRNGQFFYEWNRKKNMITVSSYRNVNGKGGFVELKDFTAYIKAELKSTLGHESESFDDCIKAEVKKNFGIEIMRCFFTRSSGNNCQTVIISSLLNSMKTILHKTECKTPSTILNTQAEFSNGFTSQYIKTDPYSKDVDISMETYGAKPKVTLRFSGITKRTQVFNCNVVYLQLNRFFPLAQIWGSRPP